MMVEQRCLLAPSRAERIVQVMHKSMILRYEPASEPLHISVKQLFLN